METCEKCHIQLIKVENRHIFNCEKRGEKYAFTFCRKCIDMLFESLRADQYWVAKRFTDKTELMTPEEYFDYSLQGSRVTKLLKSRGIDTIAKLAQYDHEDLMKLPGFGRRAARIIKSVIEEYRSKKETDGELFRTTKILERT